MPEGEVLMVRGGEASVGQGRIVARVEPDVVVVRADSRVLPDLARTAAFAVSRTPDGDTQTFGDERALEDLDASARLFVEAWRARRPKPERLGEGLPWDAPGFQPPDLPPQ